MALGAYTHTHTHTHTYTHAVKVISRNQAHAWFKNFGKPTFSSVWYLDKEDEKC